MNKVNFTKTIFLGGIIAFMMNGMFFVSCSDSDDAQPDIPGLESPVSIDGNGGSAAISFTPRGLKSVSFRNSIDSDDAAVRYYGADGQLLDPDVAITDVSKIVYEAPLFVLNVSIKGSELEFTSIDNASEFPVRVEMTLDYGYTQQMTVISISPGYPMTITSVRYDMDNAEIGTKNIEKETIAITNNGSAQSSIMVKPLENVWSTVCFSPIESWASGVAGFCYVPWFNGSGWSVNTTDTLGVWMGKSVSYHSLADPDPDTYVLIDIPPHSTVKYKVSVSYHTISVPFTAVLSLYNSQSERICTGMCSIAQPASWNVEIVD